MDINKIDWCKKGDNRGGKMSVASVESIPDRFNALYDYEVLHMPKTQIAKRYGVCTSTVDGWVQRRNYFLNRVKDIIKIVDSGKFNYFFPGDKMETEKESEKELQRKIKYLEHKVQYLEALAEICDIDIANVTKKNATELSDLLSNEPEEI